MGGDSVYEENGLPPPDRVHTYGDYRLINNARTSGCRSAIRLPMFNATETYSLTLTLTLFPFRRRAQGLRASSVYDDLLLPVNAVGWPGDWGVMPNPVLRCSLVWPYAWCGHFLSLQV